MSDAHDPTSAPAAAEAGWTSIARIAAIVAGVAAVGTLIYFSGGYIQRFAAYVESLGVWGPVVFILGYAAAAVAAVPASFLTLAAGAIFGLVEGTLYAFVAASLGATLAFLVARYLARGAVESRLADDARFAAVDRAVAEQGRKIVFLLRLSPVFPFNVLNYALGLTRISLVDYVVASIGMLPGTLLYVYTGKVVGDVATLASGDADTGLAGQALLVIGLVVTAIVTTYVTRIARAALAEATGQVE